MNCKGTYGAIIALQLFAALAITLALTAFLHFYPAYCAALAVGVVALAASCILGWVATTSWSDAFFVISAILGGISTLGILLGLIIKANLS